MSQQKQFIRKILYIVLLVALIVPIYEMGNPAQKNSAGVLTQGGVLARLRSESGLSEANLGAIDPASSTMKLATFGMRGVAIALLWNRSLDYEKKADWNNVVATGNQIIMLEPHFISIWEFVGWKLAYNASAQYDDYRERYRWVIRGFEFQQKGTQYNQTSPKLFWKAGWTISQKIGIADEKSQYRRLFREDDEFHDKQVYKERDNWLFGRNFYLTSEDLYEKGGDIGKETRIIFYSRSRMNLIRFAEWMEKDGCGLTRDSTPVFDERAAEAWRIAGDHWRELCAMRVKTVIEDRLEKGKFREMSLNEAKECQAEVAELTKKLGGMLPDGMTPESILWDRWSNVLTDAHRASLLFGLQNPASEYNPNLGEEAKPLRELRKWFAGEYGPQPEWENWEEKLKALCREQVPPELQEAFDKPSMFRTEDENTSLDLVMKNFSQWNTQALFLLTVTPAVLADKIEGDAKLEAQDIGNQLADIQYRERFSNMYREIMDCNRHDVRIEVEPEADARQARQYRESARTKFYAGQHEDANRDFLGSMAAWKRVIDNPKFPQIAEMSQFQSEFLDEVDKYTILLDQLEQIFPPDFPFAGVVRQRYRNEGPGYVFQDAQEYIQKTADQGNYSDASKYALIAMKSWSQFLSENSYYPLLPLPEIRRGIVDSVKLFVENLEKAPAEEMATLRQQGLLENYPLKQELELYLSKGEPLYQEIQKTNLAMLTDSEGVSAAREKLIDLWTQVVAHYPILKYDRGNEFRPQIVQVVSAYLAQLQENGAEKPEDFPLNDFLQ